ncbi:MAG: hypothetical protein GY754_07640 [bacterium]|nr:hypothetical protein [bacterium]
MTMDELFSILAAAASKPETTVDEIYESLESAGIPPERVDRLIKFTQVAWGRVFLSEMGITFSNEYFCFGADGTVTESGQLDTETFFAYATTNVDRYKSSQAFKFLALTSADAHCVNDALNDGAKAEDLETAPAFLFLEEPDDAGLEKAQEFIAQQMQLLKSGESQKH